MEKTGDNLARLQRKFIIGGIALAPVAPLLYLQGQITRWKVGVLPDAAGERRGRTGEGEHAKKLFVIGESTVAGLGARTHELALAGQFAKQLAAHLNTSVEWHVLGRNGVTARRTIDELIPQMPQLTNGEQFDYILLGLGGNDVMRLSSPRKWRRDMTELLAILRGQSAHARIFITNCPMIVASPIMPEPIRGLLWRLSQMHDANIREFTAEMNRVYYYPQPVDVRFEGFFADGIHPSEQGYADWAAAMMRNFTENHKW
ncbi:MAG: SGNH/GDSL hydrolase family protein [Pyrinomonadaceae bacterium]